MNQEKWRIMTFEELTDQVFLGKIPIQEPIRMLNLIGDEMKHISFLSYLLQYYNIHKENLHHILMMLFSQFHQRINQMILKESIRPFFKQILDEWESPEPVIDLSSLSSNDEITLLTMAQEASSSCKDTERLISHSHNIPLESKLNGGSPLEREIGSTTIFCEKVLDELKEHQIKSTITTVHLLFIIGFSIVLKDLIIKDIDSFYTLLAQKLAEFTGKSVVSIVNPNP